MPNIVLIEDSQEENDVSDDATVLNLCKICTTATGKYTCPRCNVIYCSVGCYQAESHGSCSEAFYRECVLEDMGTQEGDAESQRKMMEILQRLQQNEVNETAGEDIDNEDLDSDDECEQDLADRLTSVDLDDADSVWEKLTAAERQEFEDLVNSGDVTKLLPVWTPWWTYRKEKKLVVEVEAETGADDFKKTCPVVKDEVPALSHITKAAPSTLVEHNVANVLGAYCYVARWFNGDHLDFSTEAVQALLTLSGNIAQGNNYQSTEMALEAVAHEAVNWTWLGGCPESTSVMKSDVANVLRGPGENDPVFYLQAALSDIHAMLSAAKRQKPTDKSSSQFARRFGDNVGAGAMPPLTKEKLRLCVKKVEYLLSWSKDYAVELFSGDVI